ncbi:acyl-CoA dehydrogenase family protein [Thauera sp. 63]|uniref:acyl-CoA dehydrogenase family protein n=1 Tax=Thauera sp. 63 TaxID=497321 RepID=UPI0009FB0817|nr:acyl-CoA dehydrogenase family protein [Thauera sp. 63]
MQMHDELLGRAREIAGLVERSAQQTDIDGRISDQVLDQICDAGLIQTLVPKMYGGHELGYKTMQSIISEIAPYCTSTAWVTSFYIGHAYIHTLFPKQSQDEVFATKPNPLTPGTIAPNFTLRPEGDGFIANGRSQWNSGSSRSDYYLCCGVIKNDDQAPELRAFLVPTKECRPIRNWDVAGMRGTDSSDMELNNVFVPGYHTARVSDLLNGTAPGSLVHENPKYSMPLFPFVLGETVPVMVGAYRGAANTYAKFVKDRSITFGGSKAANKQLAQLRLGRGIAGAELAETLMRDYTNTLESMTPEKLRNPEVRAALKARVGLILEYCTDGINLLIKAGGGGAFRNDCALQRFFRDINMLRVHGLLDSDTATETYGRVLLGLNSEVPM